MKKIIYTIVVLASISLSSKAQNNNEPNENGGAYNIAINNPNNPCISPQQYKSIEREIAENRQMLGLNNKSATTMTTHFDWPLAPINGLNDCSYYYITAYVDEDTTAGHIKDYNCGTNTYDGHRGNDIASLPYPFYKMDNNQLSVIAAAPGIIVNKVDGNFDKNCAGNNSTANYIIVEHADGSVALYWHMKKNSLTVKTVGQSVLAGEFLGIVGSSGSSSAPHLHFEVWSGTTANTLQDVYSGTCNIFNANTWWNVQKPYTEPAIVKAQVNLIAPVLPACPTTETPNEDTCFVGTGSARFYIFMRNETASTTVNERIVNPNGSTFSSWTHNCSTNNVASYYYFVKPLPTTTGTYTFETTYNGIVCSKQFKINCAATGIDNTTNSDNRIAIFPNPTNGTFIISQTNANKTEIEIHNIVGELIYKTTTTTPKTTIDLSKEPKGIYFVLTTDSNKNITNKKIVIQ
jgi:murein DD-endopeptidase MepM/ murein hydrolase activator NlpD